jgi:hypothetical protein
MIFFGAGKMPSSWGETGLTRVYEKEFHARIPFVKEESR